MKPARFDLHSLPVQLILSFAGLVLLTAAAVGVPAIWLIRTQLERQAWAQVEQGRAATQALYAARLTELTSLATLTAQRPTLQELLAQNDQPALPAYLATLQAGAGLDMIQVCAAARQPVAQAGQPIPDNLCQSDRAAWFAPVNSPAGQQLWLFATRAVGQDAAPPLGWVSVGQRLDNDFSRQMRAQTGLEHTLLAEGRPVVSSLTARLSSLSPPTIPDESGQYRYNLAGQPYYALTSRLSPPDADAPPLEIEVALPVAGIAATQRGLVWTMLVSMMGIIAVGSVLGMALARQISRPLARLTKAAAALSQGQLDSSMAVEAPVREVALVARALERARIDLLDTLAQLRQEKAWVDHLLEAIVEGIVTLDDQNRITFFSHGAARITGWARDEVVGRPCDEVFKPAETDQPFSRLIPPPDRRHKITVTLPDHRQATLAVTGARLLPPDTDNARIALVFRDVSEEEAVHRLMGHFLANVAHEFRTPLSALAASVELLLDQAPDLSPADLHELLTSLHLGILGLHTLVDNLLESASIEAGRFRVHPRPTRLGKIIAEAIRVMQPLLDKRGQRLMIELPAALPVVQADPRRVGQVLVNLLSNAGKYGPDDAEITIGVTVGADKARVTVADRGPGIAPEYRRDLFVRLLYPASDSDKARYGAGLGLSVVKAVVEAHQGQVGVDDRPGGGSVFWFTLPVEQES
jgi:two-component system phosphate regulon sensor histidine kinase PhoR